MASRHAPRARRSTSRPLSRMRASSELFQEAQVVVVEQPDVRHPVLQRRDPLDPHAPGEALVALGVVAVLAHVLEHVRVDLAGAEQLDPTLALAERPARAVPQEAAVAVEAVDVELDARLGEREEVRAQPDAPLLAEDRAREG